MIEFRTVCPVCAGDVVYLGDKTIKINKSEDNDVHKTQEMHEHLEKSLDYLSNTMKVKVHNSKIDGNSPYCNTGVDAVSSLCDYPAPMPPAMPDFPDSPCEPDCGCELPECDCGTDEPMCEDIDCPVDESIPDQPIMPQECPALDAPSVESPCSPNCGDIIDLKRIKSLEDALKVTGYHVEQDVTDIKSLEDALIAAGYHIND